MDKYIAYSCLEVSGLCFEEIPLLTFLEDVNYILYLFRLLLECIKYFVLISGLLSV